MAEVYVTLIIKGVRTYEQVPKVLQAKVAEILAALDLQELLPVEEEAESGTSVSSYTYGE